MALVPERATLLVCPPSSAPGENQRGVTTRVAAHPGGRKAGTERAVPPAPAPTWLPIPQGNMREGGEGDGSQRGWRAGDNGVPRLAGAWLEHAIALVWVGGCTGTMGAAVLSGTGGLRELTSRLQTPSSRSCRWDFSSSPCLWGEGKRDDFTAVLSRAWAVPPWWAPTHPRAWEKRQSHTFIEPWNGWSWNGP